MPEEKINFKVAKPILYLGGSIIALSVALSMSISNLMPHFRPVVDAWSASIIAELEGVDTVRLDKLEHRVAELEKHSHSAQ